MAKVVGNDLGTTNSCIAVIEGGRPVVIANAEGTRTTPSVMAYAKNGDRLVGQIAKCQAVMNPENTFYSVKRFIGRKYDEVSNEMTEVSYQVLRDGNGNVKLDCPTASKQFAPEEISAQVLRKLADDASKYLGEPVKQAVIKRNEGVDLLDRCRIPVEQALKDAKLSPGDIDEVVLVGGSTRIPAVQELVRRIAGKDPLGDKVPAADKSRVEGLITDLREAIKQENVDRMKSLSDELQQAQMQIGSTVYRQTQDGAAAGATTGYSSGGKGWRDPSGDRTDELVQLKIVSPKSLSTLEREYWQKLQQINAFAPQQRLQEVQL